MFHLNLLQDTYKNYASVFTSDDENFLDNTPEWMIPVDIKNLTYCGGGATVILDRRKVSKFLKLAVHNKVQNLLDVNDKSLLIPKKK